jgi:hypothetical protein
LSLSLRAARVVGLAIPVSSSNWRHIIAEKMI